MRLWSSNSGTQQARRGKSTHNQPFSLNVDRLETTKEYQYLSFNRFSNALTPVYFRRADAFVIVYDVTDAKTFKATKKWVSVIKAALREQPPVIMLVGNKSDRVQQRCVAVEDGRALALVGI